MKRSMILSSWSSSSEVSWGRLGASGFGLRGGVSSAVVGGSPDRKAASTTVRSVGVIGGSRSGGQAHFRGGCSLCINLRGEQRLAVAQWQGSIPTADERWVYPTSCGGGSPALIPSAAPLSSAAATGPHWPSWC